MQDRARCAYCATTTQTFSSKALVWRHGQNHRGAGCTFMKDRLISSPSQAFSSKKCRRSNPPPDPRPSTINQSQSAGLNRAVRASTCSAPSVTARVSWNPRMHVSDKCTVVLLPLHVAKCGMPRCMALNTCSAIRMLQTGFPFFHYLLHGMFTPPLAEDSVHCC